MEEQRPISCRTAHLLGCPGGAPQMVEQSRHVLLVPTWPVRASAFLHFIPSATERYNRSFTSLQAAKLRCCSRDSPQHARHPGGGPWGVCIDEALHDGFIFLAVLICFLFLCSAAKSWPFISFFYPQRISCN